MLIGHVKQNEKQQGYYLLERVGIIYTLGVIYNISH